MKNLFLAISASFFFACGSPEKQESQPQPVPQTEPTKVELTAAQLQQAQLVIGKPTMRKLGTVIQVNGFVEAPPQNKVSISFPFGGYLKYTKLIPGMLVRRGDVLATLEDPQYITLQQDYLTTKARLEFLSADLARQETLNRDQSVSDKALQMAKAEFQTQQIAAKALAEKLKLLGLDPQQLTADAISKSVQVRAPMNAYVAAVNGNVGKYFSPTDVLFELVNTENIHLTLHIFEKDLPSFQLGQKVAAFNPSSREKQYHARVTYISQQVGADRSVEVHCELENPGRELIPGMFMTASVETGNREVLAVPSEAIVRFDNKHYVFVSVSDTVFDMVEVRPGISEDEFSALESVSGAPFTSQNLVLKNAYTLLMKMKNAEE